MFVWDFRPTREFFTHMETSPIPVKGFKFRLMLGTYSHGGNGGYLAPL